MLTNQIKKNRTEILNFLSDFIGYPSEAPKEGEAQVKECMLWLKEQLVNWGWDAYLEIWEEEEGELNLGVRLPGKSGKKTLMFNGHADVVPVRKEEEWSMPPYEGVIKDGKLWGRGSSDMKGGVVAFLWAAKLMRKQKKAPQHDLVLTVNIGEESARQNIGVESCLEKGYTAPFVINAEPTNLKIARAGVGWFFYQINVLGKSTHPANKHICLDESIPVEERPGVDGISKLRKVMNSLDRLDKKWHKKSTDLLPEGSMNMTCVDIRGGNKVARMADEAEATYAVVFHPPYTSEDIVSEIEEKINEIAKEDVWLKRHKPQIKAPVIDPCFEPFILEEDHQFLRQVKEAFKKAEGEEPTTTFFRSPCDANMIAAQNNAVLILGPGNLDNGCHGIDEYIPTEQVIKAVRLYAQTIDEIVY